MAGQPQVVRAVGIDPGPTETGWCVAETGRDARGLVRFIAGGNAASTRKALSEVLDLAGPDTIVAIEVPAGYIHEAERGAALLATARVAGLLVGMAAERGHRVLELPAAQWRRGVCGRNNPSDAVVKIAVTRVTVNAPGRWNAHVRDALGVAIAALWAPTRAQRVA